MNADTRSQIYAGLIRDLASSPARFECDDCDREAWACECHSAESLPAYQGCDPARYITAERTK